MSGDRDGVLRVSRDFAKEYGFVVLDPESDEDAARLHDALPDACRYGVPALATGRAVMQRLVAKPKLPEPKGLGAVVADDFGDQWVLSRIRSPALLGVTWENARTLSHRRWEQIATVRVLSKGKGVPE